MGMGGVSRPPRGAGGRVGWMWPQQQGCGEGIACGVLLPQGTRQCPKQALGRVDLVPIHTWDFPELLSCSVQALFVPAQSCSFLLDFC